MYKTTFRDKKVALIFGNEHRGVSDTVLALADEKLHIPMRGFVQSLNISVTAGICLFELSRQRQRTRKKFLLSPQKRKMLTKHWK
jgi:tRNA (guanosine-2'-O-)-methyltransferase